MLHPKRNHERDEHHLYDAFAIFVPPDGHDADFRLRLGGLEGVLKEKR
jgi:hypothetical protein